MTSLGCVTGRFQPLHRAHVELLLLVAARHDHLVVGITNPDPSTHAAEPASESRHEAAANPFTYYERYRFVHASLTEAGLVPQRFSIVPFPLHQPDLWYSYVPRDALQYVRIYSPWEQRKVELLQSHYTVEVIEPDEPKAMSSSDIRSARARGVGWRALVPPAVSRQILSYGENQPRIEDTSAPALLIVLDGLGDRGIARLDGATPSEAARTPNLDALAARGASGVHVPFGPGRAVSSEHAHWAMLGYPRDRFPGRAILEGLGAGEVIEAGILYLYGALRPAAPRADGSLAIVGRACAGADDDDCATLSRAIARYCTGEYMFELTPRARGESIIAVRGPVSGEITDSDPLFEEHHPFMRPRAFAEAGPAATATAQAVESYLRWARSQLVRHPVNEARARRGAPPLDVLTTKWPSLDVNVANFAAQVGVRGAIVSDTNLYRGFAQLLGMANCHRAPSRDLATDFAQRLDDAAALVTDGLADFVLVHVKATDEAGHSKDPFAKLAALEQIDTAVGLLAQPPFCTWAIAVTGDHASPSTGGVLHTGDPTPFVLCGPGQRPDPVSRFGERFAATGSLGCLRARDVLPLVFSAADRPSFSGTRMTPYATVALPTAPEPLRFSES